MREKLPYSHLISQGQAASFK